jgi:predicted NUDIX family NTP pyrophosphohydrolase
VTIAHRLVVPRKSAGLLLYRRHRRRIEVFIVHPGGPFFARRDEGHWSVPKGEIEGGEQPRSVARREFEEETGRAVDACTGGAEWVELGEITQRGGKRVVVWAAEGDWPDGLPVASNTIPVEWPPRSGRMIEIPEVDQGLFFEIADARRKLNPAQEPFLDRLLAVLQDADEQPG